jgi:hypothetical protein
VLGPTAGQLLVVFAAASSVLLRPLLSDEISQMVVTSPTHIPSTGTE